MKKREKPRCLPPADERTEAVRETVHGLFYTMRLHRAAIERSLAKAGIHPSQHRMLVFLHRNGGAAAQRALSEEFNISPAAVAVTLRKLEEGGYISRIAEKEDGRRKSVRITAAGEAILKTTYHSFTAVDLAMFEGFSEEELAAFGGTLLRMQESLAAIAGEVEE